MRAWLARLWLLLCGAIAAAVLLFAFTDIWPFMHEVIWQQSWKPVCTSSSGELERCRP